MERWLRKVAIVTGASAGIGAAIALQLAENGIIVAGLARRSEKVDELNQKLGRDAKGKIHGINCDLTKEEDILKSLKWIKDNLGNVHILINNAGWASFGPFVETTTDVWKTVFDINVLAVATLTREFLKQAAENNIAGHIVTISSTFGLQVEPLKGNALAPSKFAIQALQEVVRQELTQAKSKVKVTTVCPGATESESFQANVDKIVAGTGIDPNVIPRLNPEDVANAVIFAIGTPPEVQIQQIILRPLGG